MGDAMRAKHFTRVTGRPWGIRTRPTRTHPLKRFSSEARTLQWIDRRIGAPVCFALTLVRRMARVFGGPREAPVRSILFLKLAEQGSTVLAHEAVKRAVARVGRANVHFLVFEENRFIVDVIGLVPHENVFTVRTGSAWAMATSAAGVISAIRRRKHRRLHRHGILRPLLGGDRLPDRRPGQGGFPRVLRRGPVPRGPDDPQAALQPAPAHEPGLHGACHGAGRGPALLPHVRGRAAGEPAASRV
jgi:hypothetical protein